MLKTIPTNQVKLEMYIHSLEGAWVDHPFWKTSFILEDYEDLKKLQASGVKRVVIDVDKGLGVLEKNPIELKKTQQKKEDNKNEKR